LRFKSFLVLRTATQISVLGTIDRHDLSSFCCYRVTPYKQYQTPPIVYSGPDPISKFYDHVILESHLIDQIMSHHVPMKPLTSLQEPNSIPPQFLSTRSISQRKKLRNWKNSPRRQNCTSGFNVFGQFSISFRIAGRAGNAAILKWEGQFCLHSEALGQYLPRVSSLTVTCRRQFSKTCLLPTVILRHAQRSTAKAGGLRTCTANMVTNTHLIYKLQAEIVQ